MASATKLVKLTVVENATQDNVTGPKNWAAVKENSVSVIIEARTSPKNIDEEWKQIRWSGDAVEQVPGKPNRRRVSRAVSKKYHVEAALGGVADYVDVWILWATIEILIKGTRPVRAAPFDPGTRDGTDKLGAVTYKSLSSSVIDEKAGLFVDNIGAAAKVAPVATLLPKGVSQVVKSGWAFEREVWSRNWADGRETKQTNTTWTRDTSKPNYLKLTPDSDDKIYDLDSPDLRWGQMNCETYNNFRQWIEWNKQDCSAYALWYWQARWALNKEPSRQITLNDLGAGNITLPTKPNFPARKSP
jgi:hypothetical protein